MSRFLRPALFILLATTTLSQAATLIWTNTAGGDWATAANWKPNSVPTATDNAYITNNGTYTVTVDDTAFDTVSNLVIGGVSGSQTLDIAGALILNGACTGNVNATVENYDNQFADSAGGELYGGGTLYLLGSFQWEAEQPGVPAGGNLNLALSSITTSNALLCTPNGFVSGPVNFTGTNWVNLGSMVICFGPLNLSASSVLSNAPGATINFGLTFNNPDNIIPTNGIGGSGAFYNAGELLITDTNGQDFVQSKFINTGTIVVTNNATLSLTGGGTNSSSATIWAGCSLITSNFFDFSAGSTISGPGTFSVLTSAELDGTVNCATFNDDDTGTPVVITGTMSSTSNNIIGNATFTNSATLAHALVLGGGTVTFNGTGSIAPSSVVMGSLGAGILAGTDPVLDSGIFDWYGGKISGILQCNGGLIANDGILIDICNVNGGTLINTGAMTVQDTYYAPNISEFTIGSGGVFSNAPSGTVTFFGGSAGTVPGSGSGVIGNGGTMNFTNVSGAAANYVLSSFVNSGTLNVNSNATLTLENGATNSGSIILGTNVSLDFSSGSFDFYNGSTVTVPGAFTFNISGGAATIGGVFDVGGIANFVSGTGTFSGSGTFSNVVNVSGGTLNIQGANNLTGSNNFSGGTANFTGTGNLTGPIVVDSGTANFSGTGSITAPTFSLSSGTAEGTQTVQVLNSGGFAWTGGSPYGIVQFNGGTIPNGGNLFGTFINSGVLGWTNGIYFYGGHLTNLASGTINLGASTSCQAENGTPDFDNDGIVNATGAGTTSLNVPFNNYGTVTLSNNGILAIGNGGTENGAFNIGSGSTLDFDGGTFAINSGSTISDAGNFQVNGGIANLMGTVNVAGTSTFSSGTANVTGPFNFTNALVVSGGTLNLSGTGATTLPTFILSNGTIEGSQNVQVLNAGGFTWSGGSFYQSIFINGGSIPNGGNFFGTLVNSGVLGWTNGIYFYGGHLTNMASGTVNIAASASCQSENGTPNFDNDGLVNTTGAGTTSLNVPFNNYGMVTLSNNGTLALGNGGTENGSFGIGSGSTLDFDGGTFAINSGSTIADAGNFQVNGGTVNLMGTVYVAGTSTFSSGTANATGDFILTNGLVVSGGTFNLSGTGVASPPTFTLNNGNMEGSQTVQVINAGGFTWSGGNFYDTILIDGGAIPNGGNLYGTLVNSGVLGWTNTIYFYGGQLTNLASGTINPAPAVAAYAENGTPDIENSGQMNFSGPGTSTINIPLYNYGAVNISNSALLNLGNGGTETGTFLVTSGANLDLNGNTFTLGGNCTIGGPGTFTVASGTIYVTNNCVFTNPLVLSGGALVLSANAAAMTPNSATITGGYEEGTQTLQITNAGAFTWNGGAIYGLVVFNGGSIPNGGNLYGSLVNSGILSWGGNIFFFGGRVTNLLGGTLNLAAGQNGYSENGSPYLENDGQFNASGPGTSSFNLPFNNYGTVTISNNGTFNLSGSGLETGTFNVTSGANFSLNGNPITLGGNCTVGGLGTFSVTGGATYVTNNCVITNTLALSGGTLNLNANAADVTLNAATISGGNEEGTQTLQITNAGAFTWSGGSIYGLVVFNGGNIPNGGNLYGIFVNSGLLTWNGNIFFYGGHITNLLGATINLAAGQSAYFENGSPYLENDGQLNATGPGTSTIAIPFSSYGTVTISNNGTLNPSYSGLETGTFNVTAGANFSLNGNPITLGGNCTVGGPGTFSVTGGATYVTNNCVITNTLALSGGTLNLNANAAAETLTAATISGGTEEGTQTLQITNAGAFTWSGGSIYGSVVFNGGNIPSGGNLYGIFVNSGLLTWNGNIYFYGGHITNLLGATINLAAGQGGYFENGSPYLENDGQLNATGPGTSTIAIPFNSYGTVTISNNGNLNLSYSGLETGTFNVTAGANFSLNGNPITLGGNCVVGGPGTISITGGATFVTNNCVITNSLALSGGTLNLNSSAPINTSTTSISGGTEQGPQTLKVLNSGGFNWIGGSIYGTIQCNGGTLTGQNLDGTIVNTGPLAWNNSIFFYGGQITNLGSGTINLASGAYAYLENGSPTINNGGVFNVSGPSTTTINVPFNNSGTLNILSGVLDLPGSSSLAGGVVNCIVTNTTNFTSLSLSGATTLTGGLGVTFQGYTPKPGDFFPLVTYGSEYGLFSLFNLPPAADWNVFYGPTAFSLNIIGTNAPYTTMEPAIQAPLTNGFVLLMLGPPGTNYLIQSAAPNYTSWTTLTNVTPTNSSVYLIDTNGTNFPSDRLYRAKLL